MKRLPYLLIVIILFYGCSSSDSPDEMEEAVVNLPSLSATSTTDIGESSVTVRGNVSNNGGATVIERGVVWSLSENPTINDNKQAVGSGTGSFTTSISGLMANTGYFVRAFATNSAGTAYGNQQGFTTLNATPVQKVFDGDVFLFTQQEINDFGSNNYTEITGQLYCGGQVFEAPSSIESLEPLSSLRSVGDAIRIFNNGPLTEINGLNNLEYIGGGLIISDNIGLSTIKNFESLLEVEVIQIKNNSSLKEVNTFNNVEETLQVAFSGNDSLQLIQGFENLRNLGQIFLNNNSGQFILDSFHELVFLESFIITDNPGLTDIIAFEKLESVPAIDIRRCEKLNSITGFNSLISLDLLILSKTDLDEINGFENLESVNVFRFTENNGLADLNGFESVTKVNQLKIDLNWKMQKLVGFQNLEEVTQSFSIFTNRSLEEISGFTSLVSCNSILLRDNYLLLNFCGLQNLFASGSYMDVSIDGNGFNPTPQEIGDGNCAQ